MNQAKRKVLSKGEASSPREKDIKTSPALSENVQEQIGAKLKALFDETANQAVPDRFVELLEALAEKEDGADGDRNEFP